MVAYQRETPGSKLNPYLVTSAGVQPNAHQCRVGVGDAAELQPGSLDAAAHPFDYEYLVLADVLPQKIFPITGFRGCAMDTGNIFLYHLPLLDQLRKPGGSSLGSGVHHHTAHILIQPMYGKDLAAQLGAKLLWQFMFGIHSHRLDAHSHILICIKKFHTTRSFSFSIAEKPEKSIFLQSSGCAAEKKRYNKGVWEDYAMTPKEFQKKSPLMAFLTYFGKHKKLFALDMLCALAVCAIDLAFPLVTRSALYEMLPNGMYRTFFTAMLIVAGSFLLRTALYYVVWFWGHTFGIRVEADVRADLFRHLQTLSFDFYDRNRTGQLMSRLTTDLFELTELAHHGPEDIVISGVTIIGSLIIMATIQWQLALVVAVLIPIFLVVVLTMRKKLGDVSVAVKQKTGHINTEIEASLSGIRTAKAFANEQVENRRFAAANGVYRDTKRWFHKFMARFNSTMDFFLTSLNVVVIAVGGYLIMKGQMDYRDLITFTLYTASFVTPMRRLSTLSEMLANGLAGLNRFMEIMRTEPTIQDKPGAATLEQVEGSITVENVSFAYDGDLDVLHDVSLQVSPGETVAIVGPSGGGKSTLCQLIPRFYEVSSGSIRVDGVDVRDVTQHSLRASIGIVQQDVFLFADTVFENIRYGRMDAAYEEVVEAARKAEILDDILAMPQGFDTYVGERGALLSGGQKQRIAIARIFLKNPPILILDEATSALDSVTEAKIQSAFDALSQGRTTLIIAHRLSTVRNADRIISIADGVITESGTHESLVNTDGIYAKLYKTQNALALEGK